MRRSPLPWSKRILLALLAGVLTIVASQGQWLWRQDEAAYDALVGNWDYRPDPSVLIVAIDEGSLQRIGQWPWPRSVHARLLDRLTDAGAAMPASERAAMAADALVDAGLAVADPIVYEDFLPVSAAGIFQSNLGGGEQHAYDAHANQEAFEAALGKAIHDPFALYARAQDASIAALRR